MNEVLAAAARKRRAKAVIQEIQTEWKGRPRGLAGHGCILPLQTVDRR